MNALLAGGACGQSGMATERSNQSCVQLESEQSMNPMRQVGNINELNIENLFKLDDAAATEACSTRGATKSTAASTQTGQAAANKFRLSYNNYCAVT